MNLPGSLDTVTFKLPEQPGDLSALTYRGKTTNDRGQDFTKYSLDNLVVFVSEYGTTIKNSLPRFYHGNNWTPLTLSDTKNILIKISDLLSMDVMKAKVKSLDYFQDIITDYPPELYFRYLGESPELKIKGLFNKTSLYYKNGVKANSTNGNIELLFYDKVKEIGKKNISQVLKDSYVLRVEMSLTNRPDKQLKTAINGASLYDPMFMKLVHNRYLSAYESIHKIYPFTMSMTNVNDKKDFRVQLMAFAIETLGLENVFGKIGELKALGVFGNRLDYSNLKRELRLLHSKGVVSETFTLIDEITQKVRFPNNKM